MRPRVVLLGATGQIGSAIAGLLDSERCHVFGRESADLSNPEKLREFLASQFERLAGQKQKFVVINAAAYTDVDGSERNEDLARRINSQSPGVLADLCLEFGATLVHFSTDYVFDGVLGRPYLESDLPHPLNRYGQTKLEGERAVVSRFYKNKADHYFLIRTSWIYDARIQSPHRNFLKTMLRLGLEKESVTVVNDQVGVPNFAPHVARAVMAMVDSKSVRGGTYHVSAPASEQTSWWGFANEIFATLRESPRFRSELRIRDVVPVSTPDYTEKNPGSVRRPLRSTLDSSKLEQVFGVSLPSWREGLREAVASL